MISEKMKYKRGLRWTFKKMKRKRPAWVLKAVISIITMQTETVS